MVVVSLVVAVDWVVSFVVAVDLVVVSFVVVDLAVVTSCVVVSSAGREVVDFVVDSVVGFVVIVVFEVVDAVVVFLVVVTTVVDFFVVGAAVVSGSMGAVVIIGSVVVVWRHFGFSTHLISVKHWSSFPCWINSPSGHSWIVGHGCVAGLQELHEVAQSPPIEIVLQLSHPGGQEQSFLFLI